MENYVYIKALHVIFMVAWFAALFYMPRLLIYHVEAQAKPEPDRSILSEQLKIMQRRLWKAIAWPAMILTWIFGLWMLVENQIDVYDHSEIDMSSGNLILQPWFILKIVFVCALSLYHVQTHVLMRKQQQDEFPWTSFRLRLWNEIATLCLFAIIFLVIPKKNSGWIWATLGFVLLAASIFAATVIYKKNREKNEEPPAPPTEPPAEQ